MSCSDVNLLRESDESEMSDAGASSAGLGLDSDNTSVLSGTESSMSRAPTEDDDDVADDEIVDDGNDQEVDPDADAASCTAVPDESQSAECRKYSLRNRNKRSEESAGNADTTIDATNDNARNAEMSKSNEDTRDKLKGISAEDGAGTKSVSAAMPAAPTQNMAAHITSSFPAAATGIVPQNLSNAALAAAAASSVKIPSTYTFFQPSTSTIGQGSEPFTRSRAAKLRASLAIQSQIQPVGCTVSSGHHTSLVNHASQSRLGSHTQAPYFPGAIPTVRSMETAPHSYIVSPYLQRSPPSAAAAAAAAAMSFGAPRFVSSPQFPHQPFNMEDVSQFWSPNPPDMTSLPLFQAGGHAHPFHPSFPSPHSMPHTPVTMPPTAALPPATATTGGGVPVPGSGPANSSSICATSASIMTGMTGLLPQTPAATSSTVTSTNTMKASMGSSIAAAAHSTTQPTTRSGNRRHHKSSGGSRPGGRDSGSMSKAERRRNKASIRERKRVVSLNDAFLNLKRAMPFVPPDTKLSKIKTLRFAIRYVKRLMDTLDHGDAGERQGGHAMAQGSGQYDADRLDHVHFDTGECFSSYGGAFDDFDLEMDFNTSSHASLPDVPITINDSDLDC
ncbi:mucin-5AC-like [Sycon ciliatum]|uniref:mucin-5AC-like n=1 Tax=Sycon ciliatum TaxID=27933 RepID=UPI0031F69556